MRNNWNHFVWGVVLISLLARGVVAEELLAAEPKARPPAEKESAWPADKIARERAEWMARSIDATINQRLAELKRETAAKQPAQLLARSVRLEFRAEPAGTEEHPLVVRTATDRFTVGVARKGRGQGANIRISGQIQITEGGHILVVHDSSIDFASQEGDFNVTVSGGIKLLPGRPATLATLGDRQWIVVATFDEEAVPLAEK